MSKPFKSDQSQQGRVCQQTYPLLIEQFTLITNRPHGIVFIKGKHMELAEFLAKVTVGKPYVTFGIGGGKPQRKPFEVTSKEDLKIQLLNSKRNPHTIREIPIRNFLDFKQGKISAELAGKDHHTSYLEGIWRSECES